jgi:hypothetical protein
VPEPLPDKPRNAGGFDFWAAALVNVMQTDTLGRPKVMGVAEAGGAGSETVALGHPIVPVRDGFVSRFVPLDR